jgi:hypothetical protein
MTLKSVHMELRTSDAGTFHKDRERLATTSARLVRLGPQRGSTSWRCSSTVEFLRIRARPALMIIGLP